MRIEGSELDPRRVLIHPASRLEFTMKNFFAAVLVAGLLVVCGCDTVSQRRLAGVSNTPHPQTASLLDSERPEREPNPVSLFPADQAILPDTAVANILSSS